MPPKRKRVQTPRGSTRGSATLEVNNQTESTSMESDGDGHYRRRYETPPVFDPEKITYDEWKTTLADWCHLTGTRLEDQGTAVRMHLLGSARQAVQHVELADIRSKNGVQKVLEELDREVKTLTTQPPPISLALITCNENLSRWTSVKRKACNLK